MASIMDIKLATVIPLNSNVARVAVSSIIKSPIGCRLKEILLAPSGTVSQYKVTGVDLHQYNMDPRIFNDTYLMSPYSKAWRCQDAQLKDYIY